ncbi:translocating chain-associated membrane protein 1-like 1 [Ditylenchus destructor]|uniref:Translocating chain-associated membrane protein 1-like 1 n=1 Tax=Ditylenchus destructor TaxID=166010 RepID=A0AAD4MU45_9BILA|nr:translocating chain-associated membrane protein 1-like 1 [Ditylenchus destructor]
MSAKGQGQNFSSFDVLLSHRKFLYLYEVLINQVPIHHILTEFYFQKLKRDEIRSRTVHSILFFGFTSLAYFANFNRPALAILFFQYVFQSVFHLSRLLYFTGKVKKASTAQVIVLVQLYMLFNFCMFHFGRFRERTQKPVKAKGVANKREVQER